MKKMYWMMLGAFLVLFTGECTARRRKIKKQTISQEIHQDKAVDSDKKGFFDVRVLMKRAKKSESFEWVIKSKHGFFVSDFEDPGLSETIYDKKITLTLQRGSLAINGRRLAFARVKIMPRSGYLKVDNHLFDGNFLFIRDSKMVYLINSIDLEEYLFSVLRWESWPGWPLEVNRAFAIMCRTYVVNKILEVRKKKKIYDIRNSNIHQTYKGVHGFDILREAIKDTERVILAYNGKPIVAMYDSCCGGIIPADLDGVDFVKAPYLAREYACNYCQTSKLYRWRLIYNLTDFGDLIKDGRKNALPVRDMHITKRDKAGTVHEVVVKTNSSEFALSGRKIYSLLKDIKSMSFNVQKKGKELIFRGKGFGHHLGLCQWGARQMVREGWKYKEILRFFYPGITFMKVEVV